MKARGQRRGVDRARARDRGRVLRGERRQHGEADRAADLARGVHQAGGEARLRALNAGRRRDRHRHEGEADPGGGDHGGQQHVGEIGAVGRHAGEEHHPDRDERHAAGEDPAGADARGRAARHRRRRHDRQRHRQEGDAGPDRGVAEHLLQVQRHEVPHGEDRRAEHEDDDVGGGQHPRREDLQRHERPARVALDDDEGDEQRQPGARHQQRLRRGPAVDVGAHDRVGEDDEARRDADGARHVELALARGGAGALRDQAHGGDRGDDADRDVDEQDPLPAEQVGEDAADEHAGGAAGAAHGAPRRQRAVALRPLAERRREDRERRRRDDRAAEALHAAGDHEHRLAAGQAADQRGGGEQQQPEDEHAPAAEEVGGAAAEQQEARERQRVGVDDPLQVDRREAQVGADRRQRDVHDGDVEDDHELRQAAQHEDHSPPCGIEPLHAQRR